MRLLTFHIDTRPFIHSWHYSLVEQRIFGHLRIRASALRSQIPRTYGRLDRVIP
jgi:hypothetical protein